ncbi:MAG: alpha/beta fold hydrolase [Xanthomonadaceae bacterium]|jgi:pimeloyl-ACP methyl ester carboxylesterase|nr:alpha/beta fold hydrolase [Xanthomonadaceae bacterium]
MKRDMRSIVPRCVRGLLLLCVALPLLVACAATRPDPAPRIVLVHGAWMGAWAWDGVVRELARAGFDAVAVELPAHGDDPTPPEAASLDAYVDAVLRALPADGRVVLVGHSMGGIVISAVAERAPERIARLVYVAGYLPRSGESLYALSQTDTESEVGRHWRQDDPARYSPASIDAAGRVAVFCADCGADAAARLVARHRPEPVPPLATPVALSDERFGRVPRVYLGTRADRAVGPALQQRMVAAAPGTVLEWLEGGHAPMLAQPQRLAQRIVAHASP